MIFDRLAIGTANWGKEYNGAKVSEDDQKRILDYCQCSGIDMIDTATAYEWDWTKVSSYFKVVVKINENDSVAKIREIEKANPHCIMAHNKQFLRNGGWVHFNGVSLYDPFEYDGITENLHNLQVPYNLYDRRFEDTFAWYHKHDLYNNKLFVRSVFLRGKIIKDGIEPWKCIAFCLMNPYVDRVIIGADSFEQFKENLRPFHRMNEMAKDDESLLDPSRWKEEK